MVFLREQQLSATPPKSLWELPTQRRALQSLASFSPPFSLTFSCEHYFSFQFSKDLKSLLQPCSHTLDPCSPELEFMMAPQNLPLKAKCNRKPELSTRMLWTLKRAAFTQMFSEPSSKSLNRCRHYIHISSKSGSEYFTREHC